MYFFFFLRRPPPPDFFLCFIWGSSEICTCAVFCCLFFGYLFVKYFSFIFCLVQLESIENKKNKNCGIISRKCLISGKVLQNPKYVIAKVMKMWNLTSMILTLAKLKFFSFVTSLLELYLTKYQGDVPMLQFVNEDVKKLLKDLLALIIKPNVIAKCKHSLNFLKIDLTDEIFSNCLRCIWALLVRVSW